MSILEKTHQSLSIPTPPKSQILLLLFFLIALVLILASGLKLFEYATTPTNPADLLTHPAIVLAGSAGELFLAGWLLSGWKRAAAWHVVMVFFALAFVIAGYKFVTGASSCGCFGRVHVAPWITTLFDAAMFGTLFLSRKSWNRRPSHSNLVSRPYGMFGLTAILVTAAIIAAMLHHPAVLANDLADVNGLVVLEPEQWVGKPFPLTNSIDLGPMITHGVWRVVLFHADCSDCLRALPRIESEAQQTQRQVALVEIPPYAPPESSIIPAHTVCHIGKLDNTKEWFATTPVVVDLVDGIVKHQSTGKMAVP